jgi:hypothetical protein
MPGSVDGVQLAALVRARWPELKIVMTSGHLPEPPSGLQVDLFLSKPYRISSAIEWVKRLLDGDGQ